MAWVIFDNHLLKQNDGAAVVDFDGDTIKVALIDDTLAPAKATHDFWDDLNANEVTGDGYTAGGAAVGTKTVTLQTGVVTFDGDDVSWSQDAGGFADARYAVLYKDTGTAGTSPLVAFLDLGGNVGNVTGDLTIQMASAGIIQWSSGE